MLSLNPRKKISHKYQHNVGTSFAKSGNAISSQISSSQAFDVVAAVFAFEEKKDGVLYSSKDYALFMKEHERSLRESLDKISKICEASTPFSDSEGTVIFLGSQTAKLSDTLCDAVNKIEAYIRDQVVSAIGKEVQPGDFAEYVVFDHFHLHES